MSNAPLDTDFPGGRTRVSDAVIQKLAIAEAHAIEGVLDVGGIVVGAVVGGVAGGVVGFLEGGPAGLSLGVPAGTVAGAAVGQFVSDHHRRRKFFAAGGAKPPSIRLRLTAEFGTDLQRLAEVVRRRVQEAVRDVAGLETVAVNVEFVEVVKRP